jgi:uncharacterized coiled-coil DUF342 family protein
MFEERLRDEAKETLRDYETFVKMYVQLNRAIDNASAKLKKFPKGAKAKAEYEKASKIKKHFDAFIRQNPTAFKFTVRRFLKKNAERLMAARIILRGE